MTDAEDDLNHFTDVLQRLDVLTNQVTPNGVLGVMAAEAKLYIVPWLVASYLKTKPARAQRTTGTQGAHVAAK